LLGYRPNQFWKVHTIPRGPLLRPVSLRSFLMQGPRQLVDPLSRVRETPFFLSFDHRMRPLLRVSPVEQVFALFSGYQEGIFICYLWPTECSAQDSPARDTWGGFFSLHGPSQSFSQPFSRPAALCPCGEALLEPSFPFPVWDFPFPSAVLSEP